MYDDGSIKYLAVDLEASNKIWYKAGLIGIGIYSKEDSFAGFSQEVMDNIKDYSTIYHNGGYDVNLAFREGIELPYDHDTILMASLLQYQDNIKDFYRSEYDDTTKLEESLKLDNLALRHLNIRSSWKIDWDKDRPTYDEIKEHCIMDCRITYHLFMLYKKKLQEAGLWDYYTKLLMPFQRLLTVVERVGIRLDVDKLQLMREEYEVKLENWDEEFYNKNKEALDIVGRYLTKDKIAKLPEPAESIYYVNNSKGNIISEKRHSGLKNQDGYTRHDGISPKDIDSYNKKVAKLKEEAIIFNCRSHVHMTKLLECKGIELKDRTGAKTTASKLLWKYKHDPIISQIVDYKKDRKIYNDFLKKWDIMRVGEILHTHFRLWATKTGRLSSAEPNLQQVPKDSVIRDLFIPREGKTFIVADAKQLEARLTAYFSKEPNLIKAFKEGIDVYGQIAVDLMGVTCHPNEVKEKHPDKRQIGKQIFLGTIYGLGLNSLSYSLNKEHNIPITLDECKENRNKFRKLYPNLHKFANSLKDTATSKGYITNFFGRKVFVPNDSTYKAINYFIQGTGSDLISFSQLNIVPKLPEGARLILLVHDEIVIECYPKDTKEIVDLINKYMVDYVNKKYDMFIDMDIKVGNTWGIK